MSGLKLVNSEESGDFRLKELNKHLDTFPLSRTLANKYYAQEIVIKLGKYAFINFENRLSLFRNKMFLLDEMTK